MASWGVVRFGRRRFLTIVAVLQAANYIFVAIFAPVEDRERTNVEVGNAQGVVDGDLDEFVRAELLRRAGDS